MADSSGDAATGDQPNGNPTIAIEAFDHVALTVSDPARSMRWYQEVFGFSEAHMEGLTVGPPFILRVVGESYLNLFPPDPGPTQPVPGHDALAMRHLAFRIPFNRMESIEQQLRDKGLAVSSFFYGPRCRSIFVSDPDGHQIELIGYGEGVFVG
jgi:catechol 2,3-dioxygenase-like lactoylglutathione lyase family enzyme